MKKKKSIILITIISLLVLFVPKAEARIILPALPSGFNEEWPYIISYDPFGYVYLTYCKSTTEQIRLRNVYYSNSTENGVQIGFCYTSDGAYDGYAYRRGINQELTQEQINNYDFEINGEWGTEYQSNSRATNLSINPTTRKIITWKEYMTDSQGIWNSAVITGNTNIYNYNPSTEILLTPEDYAYEEIIEPYCTKTQPLGMFENPSEFSINISGVSNALKEPIQGIITINYEASNFINTNQWEITDKISEFTTGDYELKCSTEQQKCELWFNYNYEDDIDEEINLNFKFKTISGVNMPTFIRLYSCLKNYNDINITYDNIKNTNTGQTATENKIDNIIGGIGNILNFLNPTNLIYIIVPTEEQMQNLLNEMQESINNKLGILGLPLTIYTRLMNLANTSTQENWCLSWNGVKVPNFEDFEIISAGNWCFSQILENEQINEFRNVCINIIGGLILLAFVQYLHNTYNKVVDAPDRDEYEYITTEDVYTVNNETGELSNHVWKKRRTVREKVDK